LKYKEGKKERLKESEWIRPFEVKDYCDILASIENFRFQITQEI